MHGNHFRAGTDDGINMLFRIGQHHMDVKLHPAGFFHRRDLVRPERDITYVCAVH